MDSTGRVPAAEVREVLVAEPEGAPRLSELPHHELDGVVGRGGS